MPNATRAALATQKQPLGLYAPGLSVAESKAVYRALSILKKTIAQHGVQLSSPGAVRDFLKLELALEEREVFVCIWLDTQNRLIAAERMFVGSLTQTSVYPREIVKTALRHNAAAVILAHNHPSGCPEPSPADLSLTTNLEQALAVIDVRVLDHFIVAGDLAPTSFAELQFCGRTSTPTRGNRGEVPKRGPRRTKTREQVAA